ncbi:MAG: hypothetical protein RR061_09795 [Muribaculaceae bacterium]
MFKDEFTILKFPKDYQVGWLSEINRKRNQYDKDVFYVDAIGQVSVPSDISLMLNVNSQSAASMRWLTEIESTQLKQLYLGQTGINNENIQYISHLINLEELSFCHVYENINDLGTHYLKPLINMRKLYLNSTNSGGRKNYVTLKGIEGLQNCLPECKITACDLSYLLSDR